MNYPIDNKGNHVSVNPYSLDAVELCIQGINNVIEIGKISAKSNRLKIVLCGNNSILRISDIAIGDTLKINIGVPNNTLYLPVENVFVSIGKGCWFDECEIRTVNSNANIEVEDNVMVARGCKLLHTDNHPIMDEESGNIINRVRNMRIGSNSWLCECCTLMKNCLIPPNCIIGMGAVVTSSAASKMTTKCIVAGNPARVVRKNIRFSMDGTKGYCQNEY